MNTHCTLEVNSHEGKSYRAGSHFPGMQTRKALAEPRSPPYLHIFGEAVRSPSQCKETSKIAHSREGRKGPTESKGICSEELEC